ncbi:cytochrome c oxidase assembly protein COX11, mitochondrial-like [Mercenaria mercenaria]|uniref:cytochrome c oxidase assembly protein COX11, mitochondrial-like n=1 Tax=Mercenaria mercenaria TaxID=6596 RepID=UPI00234F4228|nr:cytochrome c oxidase assembly protein COX11, mitochondrial-like [Mercenaria mercenaria]
MATLLGSCPSLSARFCLLATRRLHSQATRHVISPHTQNVSQWKEAVHILRHRILQERSISPLSLGRKVLIRTLFNQGCTQNGRVSILPLLRQGNRSVYMRYMSSGSGGQTMSKTDAVLYLLSLLMLCTGLAYSGVPLFKIFCRQFGFGGNPELSKGHDRSKVGTMETVEDREIIVTFNADRHAAMKWNFQPQQTKIKVKPGETALAFYGAENPTDKPIIGIATYTVTPYIAAPYFNKIQCFCFEEQILNPHEKVDMPVFFYIDPDYDEDPELEFENNITLSYTFFEAKEGMSLPLPGFLKPTQETT